MDTLIPLIDTYEKFVEFNNDIKIRNPHVKTLSITGVNYEESSIGVASNADFKCIELDEFIFEFVSKRNGYIANNIENLESYDFTRLYSVTHPKEFMVKLNDYAANLTLIGESVFSMLDYDVEIIASGFKIVAYNGPARGNLVIPYGVTEIGDRVFQGSAWLKNIALPSTLKEIGFSTFDSSGLERIFIPDSVEIINTEAFSNCTNLKDVILSKNLEVLGVGAFSNTLIKTIVLPDSLEELELDTFNGCTKLSTIRWPHNLRRIGPRAFYETILKSIEIPDSVEEINNSAFANCYRLREVKLPSNLKSLDSGAFQRTNLREIFIPNSVKYIGNYVFTECYDLKDANIPESLEKIGENAFVGTPIEYTMREKLKKRNKKEHQTTSQMEMQKTKSSFIDLFFGGFRRRQ